eukprot:SAG11_NODE_26459_length_345_cov_0.609756_1_plen_59_part_10
MLLHSLAGGTGSGLGSRLATELRERYPLNYRTTHTIAPFAHGESPLQVRSSKAARRAGR